MAGTPTDERSKLANLVKYHPDDHEAIAAARARLAEANARAKAREIVAAWPPLNPETKAELTP